MKREEHQPDLDNLDGHSTGPVTLSQCKKAAQKWIEGNPIEIPHSDSEIRLAAKILLREIWLDVK